jgi:beta-glucosidase
MPVAIDLAQRLANDANIAVITLGRNSGEFNDRSVENDFTLTANEHALIGNVSQAFHAKGKKVVMVLNVGGPIETVSWRSLVDGILLAWQPGQEGGNAIADVLTGKVNPSGKLPMTFPATYSDVPSAKTFPGKELVGVPNLTNGPFAGKPAEALYEEGIYVGYRYYNTFAVKPAYEFGYGLSYTEFLYQDLTLSTRQFTDRVIAKVSVVNSGKTAGKEVVELYVSAPRQKLSKPESELRAFAKTKLLQPGEAQTLTFTLTAKDLASYDPASSAWIAEAGSYKVMVGSSSLNLKKTAILELPRELVVEKSQKLMAPAVAIKELQPTK